MRRGFFVTGLRMLPLGNVQSKFQQPGRDPLGMLWPFVDSGQAEQRRGDGAWIGDHAIHLEPFVQLVEG